MIVVSDTTPLITLLKVQHLDLLEKYFGEVQIPNAVFNELTCDSRFADVAEQMGLRIMGTIGLLMASYQSRVISADDIKICIDTIRNSGRHISEKYLKMLLEKIDNS